MICVFCKEDKNVRFFKMIGDTYDNRCYQCVSIYEDLKLNYKGSENILKLTEATGKCRNLYQAYHKGGY